MIFLWLLNDIRTPFLNEAMQFVTYFGQELLIIAVICALYWCLDKRFAYYLGFTYFTAGFCIQALKITFRIPRPWILDPKFKAVPSAIPAATGYSFPSGHTQGATCLFFPLALRSRKTWQKVLCILAFLCVGFSRMYLGCHTPKDVLVSMCLSLLIAYSLWHFRSRLEDTAYTTRIAVILTIIALALAGYTWFLYQNEIIAFKYAMDCFKASGAGLGFALGFYLEHKHLNFEPVKSSFGRQFLKFIIGILLTLCIKKSVYFIFGTSILAKSGGYFILLLWIIYLYPYIFTKLTKY
ncbi:MAG: phosphatase PAP2 family protein [Lachnospiraceae bacterium]|nr:phosphatase PAP2 family protein [Lachnospiraceae bacterium]